MADAGERELVDGAVYPVQVFGVWLVGRWDADRVYFNVLCGNSNPWGTAGLDGVQKIGERIAMPGEEPAEAEPLKDISLEDLEDGVVTIWHDFGGATPN
jgi:hypothetical protein